MSNPFTNWWRSYRFRVAIEQGNEQRAKLIFQRIENSGATLSALEKLFQQKVKLEESLSFYQRELATISHRLNSPSKSKLDFIKPDSTIIDLISTKLRLHKLDDLAIQCTGIEENIFIDFENSLADFLTKELNKIPANLLDSALIAAIQDLDIIEQGGNSQYSYKLSPYVYLLKHFPDNFYVSYIAWFLIYRSGLLPQNSKILDIGAGLGTTIFGLASLLKSMSNVAYLPNMHISYYSLEKEALLQFRGLQFWRQYLESSSVASNIYFHFDTQDIFDYRGENNQLPKAFFNLIVIADCLFVEPQQRIKSHQIFQQIFQQNLIQDGYVLIIVPAQKLLQAYNLQPSEDLEQEENLLHLFLQELGLQLEWYRYVSSTATRKTVNSINLREFASENLPAMPFLNPLKRKYLRQQFDSYYIVDSYIVLAKP